ncbi:MAG: YiiX/YebB-like N1pC/P60 family cysteine hydrolase [candidate division KSB1 bacterium]|nr:YiiX/YebB-like N1pC/P60 family cysteine hydrolase [candidate division KSB1 bacterium]
MENGFQPGDIFFTRGTGFISKAIRLFSRSFGESRTRVNHVGLVVTAGSVKTCRVVEALHVVRRHSLWKRYGPPKPDRVAVYRPLNLSREEIEILVEEANEQVGKTYGYLKLLAHLLDWFLQGAYVFRRLTRNKNYPICSWLVAHACSKIDKHFGVDPGAAQPDDIWDFVLSNPKKYMPVYPLGPLAADDEPRRLDKK